jgi:hypothetical protein
MPSGKMCKTYKSGSPAPVTLAVSFINLKLDTGCLRSKICTPFVSKYKMV